ncbi:MAG: aspartate kinase [Chitinophagaceae bacterium]|nr:aspartate kinase [Chitinophagaceae bacterium]
MQVFKFGGASVSTIERIHKVNDILKSCKGQKILVVISAMGKTTNALEKVAEAFYDNRKEDAIALFNNIKEQHTNTAMQLLPSDNESVRGRLLDIFTEVEWLLHDKPVRNYDYYYDQIVCSGELLSTCIMSAYLNASGINNTWIDVRDIIRTDNNFRDAAIDWTYSQEKINEEIVPLFNNTDIIITQGFIGSTHDNESTTLGREGSDYTAAVFANMLNAQSVTIWKDVEGVMNADPKQFPDAVYLNELNYEEVIEMAYYGAQVIHPKTVKPLQNKSIPLQVKCFLDKTLPGTIIHNKSIHNLPPVIVIKRDQALVHFHTKDFSFAGEKPVSELYNILAALHIQPNLLQTGAVSIDLCIDNKADKIEKLALSASELFNVQVEKDLVLLTVRHYQEELVAKLVSGKRTRLRQQSPETVQIVMHD